MSQIRSGESVSWAEKVPFGFLLLLLAGCGPDETIVRVATPTGDRATDRASIQEAVERVPPGGTIEFAPGRYLIGGSGIRVRTPDVTLRAHRDGTVLIGCTPEEQSELDWRAFSESCDGLYLTGGRQVLRDLTFEEFSLALAIYGPLDPESSDPSSNREGDHQIEGNIFRNVVSVRVIADADAPVVIRSNIFENVGHAVALSGRNIHVIGNRVSAPAPERVPFSWPGAAIGLRPARDAPCSDNRIEENRIDGYPEAIIVALFPQDPAGVACSGNRLLGNDIEIRFLRLPSRAGDELAGKLSLAPAIRLLNMQRAVAMGTVDWPEIWMPEGGWPAELMNGDVADNIVEGNRIVGAIGVGIELVHASGNRVAKNEIEVTAARTPEERAGLESGGNAGPGLWLEWANFDEVNGTGIWVSPGSERNDIDDNLVVVGQGSALTDVGAHSAPP